MSEGNPIESPGAATFLPLSLEGKRVIVTAGARGIGDAICQAFSQAGADIFCCDVDRSALEASGHRGVVADLRDENAVDAFMGSALDALGGLDVMVHNVGIAGPTANAEDMPQDAVEEVLRVNLLSTFQINRHAIPALKAAGGGAMINLSSCAGKFGFARRSVYSATKAGVIGLTRTLAVELGSFGISVNAILPGAVLGDRLQQVFAAQADANGMALQDYARQQFKDMALGCAVTPQDIANMALYLASPFGATISGQAISVDGGMQRM